VWYDRAVRIAVMCSVLGCTTAAPPTAPRAPPAPPITCPEDTLRALATRLHDPAPRIEIVEGGGSAAGTFHCPPKLDDLACTSLARSHVDTHGAAILDVVIAPGSVADHYEAVLDVDGVRETGEFPDIPAVTTRMRELIAQGHQVIPVREQLVYRPRGRVATVTYASPIVRYRIALLHVPIDEQDEPAAMEALLHELDGFVLRRSELRDGMVELELTCK
jgi:hypothetical protein